ncbi:hypothetical protein W911_11465 [Hyphomicrobium nitrativorans NL23]|uniref:Uncharacterized protein n=1 Tax=Hyphomicrobium nitrativorans NL23 TaxID=1029756 RepID=V5SH56_9HYPH|nr:hypothetical protein W911_11465 [Hyphomicrobium nitrativorans NL23]
MLGPAPHHVVNVGTKHERLRLSRALDLHLHGDERRVGHRDVDLFYGRHEIGPIVRVAPQHARKELHHRRAADRASLILPASVSQDFEPDVAAVRRIPALHRRRSLALRVLQKICKPVHAVIPSRSLRARNIGCATSFANTRPDQAKNAPERLPFQRNKGDFPTCLT